MRSRRRLIVCLYVQEAPGLSALALGDEVGDLLELGRAARRRERQRLARLRDGRLAPDRARRRGRTRSRRCACRGARRCPTACRGRRRFRSRRGCRRRSGTAGRARARTRGSGASALVVETVEQADALDARADQAAGLQLVQRAQPVGAGRRGVAHVDVLAADHPVDAGRARPARAPPRRTFARLAAAARSAAGGRPRRRAPSPARIATSSPKRTWQVGRPRRSSSSSIAGRSSWISE